MWRSQYSWKVITVLPSLLFWLNMRVCVLLRLTVVCPCVDRSWDLRKHRVSTLVLCTAPSVPQLVFKITEKAPTKAFSWLKAPTCAFT